VHFLFDHRLTDPAEAAVSATLKQVCAAVNGKRKTGIVKLNAYACKTLAARVCDEREGIYSTCGARFGSDAARLVIAWWTAPGNRKLVRIRTGWERCRASYTESETPSFVYPYRGGGRPAIWHLDPERITLVDTDGETKCIAVCGCGAAGSPESLAWAGGMCGPCRDHIEEHSPEAVTHEPGLLTAEGFTPTAVAFSPDARLVAARGDQEVRIWERATGNALYAGSCSRSATGAPACISFSPDGRLLVLGLQEYWRLVLLDCETDKQIEKRYPFSIESIFWTGRPNELLLSDLNMDRVYLATVPGPVYAGVASPLTDASLDAVYPDARRPRAVFSEGGTAVLTGIGRKGELEVQRRFRLGDGQHDRTGNWTHGAKLVRFTADGERILFVAQRLRQSPYSTTDPARHEEQVELWNPAKPKALLQVTFPAGIRDAHFSPDGEHLFIFGEDGTLYVCHPGLITHIKAHLHWHVGAATSFAVSKDGKTIATAGTEGVKLWPIVRLLEVL
jgi:WD40 repeat protein